MEKKNSKEAKTKSAKPRIDLRSLNSTKIKIVKELDFTPTPAYAYDGDMGCDVVAVDLEYDTEHDAYIYHTGIHVESLKGIGCLAVPRSSNRKTDAYLSNSVGIVDTVTYRGEIVFTYKNRTSIETEALFETIHVISEMPWWKRLFVNFEDVYLNTIMSMDPYDYAPYEVGDRIGQLVFIKFQKAIFEEVEELSETERGEGGHGSTGK